MFVNVNNSEQSNYASSNSVQFWHDRLGHINFEGLKKMADQEIIPNLKLKTSEKFSCESR